MCLTQAEEPQLTVAGGTGMQGCKDMNFLITSHIKIYRNIDIRILHRCQKQKYGRCDSLGLWQHQTGQILDRSPNAGGMFHPQMLKIEIGHC
jgi:hypothetical protein